MIELVEAVKCAFDHNQFAIHSVTLQLSGVGYILIVKQVQRAHTNPGWREAR